MKHETKSHVESRATSEMKKRGKNKVLGRWAVGVYRVGNTARKGYMIAEWRGGDSKWSVDEAARWCKPNYEKLQVDVNL